MFFPYVAAVQFLLLSDAEQAAVVVRVFDTLPHGCRLASRVEIPREAQRHGVVLAAQVMVGPVADDACGRGFVRVAVPNEGEEALQSDGEVAASVVQADIGTLFDAATVEPREIRASEFLVEIEGQVAAAGRQVERCGTRPAVVLLRRVRGPERLARKLHAAADPEEVPGAEIDAQPSAPLQVLRGVGAALQYVQPVAAVIVEEAVARVVEEERGLHREASCYQAVVYAPRLEMRRPQRLVPAPVESLHDQDPGLGHLLDFGHLRTRPVGDPEVVRLADLPPGQQHGGEGPVAEALPSGAQVAAGAEADAVEEPLRAAGELSVEAVCPRVDVLLLRLCGERVAQFVGEEVAVRAVAQGQVRLSEAVAVDDLPDE